MESDLEKRFARLEARVDLLMRKLDEVRRASRLSPILDEQLAAINARQGDRSGVSPAGLVVDLAPFAGKRDSAA